jgi:tetratricopeptide (TPR) repeat protein
MVFGLGGAVWLWASRIPRADTAAAAAAYGRGDWAAASNLVQYELKTTPDDPRALRLLARATARLGRHGAARALYDRVGAQGLDAEDHYLIGLGWSRTGRMDAAISAWKQALGADPDHAETLAEMALLHMHQMHPIAAVEAAGRLARQPGAQVRADLLLGMIRASDHDPAGASQALKSALARDPGARLAAEERFSTHKLLARTLLQSGQPTEARKILVQVLDAGSDPEASWLLSRARLLEGDRAGAAAALALSGPYRADHPVESEPAPYIGASRCAECHRDETRDVLSSRHARTFRRSEQLGDLPLPGGPLKDADDPAVEHVLHRHDGTIELQTRASGTVFRAVVDYALGASDRYSSLIGHDSQGTVRLLRLSYYHGARASGWDRTKDQPATPSQPGDFLGKPLDPPDGANECLTCHTTTARATRERSGPESADHAIGCEGCHGAGGLHVQAVQARFADPAILNPTIASAPALNKLCGRCHSQHLLDMPQAMTDPAWARFPGSTLPQSRCYTETGGGLSCSNCHNPHRDVETSPAYYEAKCLSCHASSSTAGQAHSPETAIRSSCPVNSQRDCLHCHMPKVPYARLHTSFTDHYIRIPSSQAVPPPGEAAPTRESVIRPAKG